MLRTPSTHTSGPGAAPADDAYAQALTAAGLVPQCIPTLRFETRRHRAAVTAALAQPDQYAGLIFTSKQAVLAAKAALDELAPRPVGAETTATRPPATDTPPTPTTGSVTETWSRRPLFAVGKGTSEHVKAAFGNAAEPLGSTAGSAAELGAFIATTFKLHLCESIDNRERATADDGATVAPGHRTAVDGVRPARPPPASPGSRAPLLFLCGDKASRDIDTALTAAQLPFSRVVAYTTETQPDVGASVAQAIARATVGCPWVAFFSPSGVDAVMPHLDRVAGLPRFRWVAASRRGWRLGWPRDWPWGSRWGWRS